MCAWARVVAVVNRVVLPTLPACTDSHPAMTHGPWPMIHAMPCHAGAWLRPQASWSRTKVIGHVFCFFFPTAPSYRMLQFISESKT
jgi:hypothetical protein